MSLLLRDKPKNRIRGNLHRDLELVDRLELLPAMEAADNDADVDISVVQYKRTTPRSHTGLPRLKITASSGELSHTPTIIHGRFRLICDDKSLKMSQKALSPCVVFATTPPCFVVLFSLETGSASLPVTSKAT